MSDKHGSTRREFISGVAAAAGTTLLKSESSLAQTQPPAVRPSQAARRKDSPNILVLCMDQWQTHMKLPRDVEFPAMRRLESRGVSFNRQYCTVPICTPSRATMWTGVHAKKTGLWDNTNFAWIGELRRDLPTIGHLLREHGYHTSFKGKWHLSSLPRSEDALETYGFSDYQEFGDMFGAPLQGAMLDDNAASEAVDWLEHKAPTLDHPWLLVCSLVNPHDIMYLRTDPAQIINPNSVVSGRQTTVQRLSWFERKWDVTLPANFRDDYRTQPFGVRHYKDFVDGTYGKIPDQRTDLWLKFRNYLINAMRTSDAQFNRVLATLDRLDLWKDTVVILTEDHGEMNGAHRMTQKGAIPFDEAATVNFTVCVPGGPAGQRTNAVGSHLDLAPTLLALAGLSEQEVQQRYPHLKGHSLLEPILNPEQSGPRGSAKVPGAGALLCWDGLHSLDSQWAFSGALPAVSNLEGESNGTAEERKAKLLAVGEKHGAPNFKNRTFFRTVVDGRHKLIRWFSPSEYANPTTLDELYEHGDVALYDLAKDPGELDNLANVKHPQYDRALVGRMLAKLHALVEREIGDDLAPFDLDLFGTRDVKYAKQSQLDRSTSAG